MHSGRFRPLGLGTSLRWGAGRGWAGTAGAAAPARTIWKVLCALISWRRRQRRCGERCLCVRGRLSGVRLGVCAHPNTHYIFFHVKNIKRNFSLAALLLGLQGYILSAFEWCSEEGLETSCRTASYSRGVPQLEHENASVRLRRSAASMTFEFPAPRWLLIVLWRSADVLTSADLLQERTVYYC